MLLNSVSREHISSVSCKGGVASNVSTDLLLRSADQRVGYGGWKLALESLPVDPG